MGMLIPLALAALSLVLSWVLLHAVRKTIALIFDGTGVTIQLPSTASDKIVI